jgi:putative FmdB family regulatory protein
MPIYEYRCTNCGHELEALQKITEPVLTGCPDCHAESLVKLVSAAGFQLKGSGWYATDFKNGSKPAAKSDTKSEGAGEKTKSETKPEGGTSSTPSTGCGSGCACH